MSIDLLGLKSRGGVAVVGGERGREGREGSGRRTRKQVLEVRD